MFGDKLTNANAKITALVALVASTGFKLDAAAILDPKADASAIPSADAFSAHLAAQQKSASDAAVSAAVAPLNAQLATLSAQAADAAALRQGLTDAGVKLGDFVTAADVEGETPEAKANAATYANAISVKEAVATAIAAKSAKQIAGAGHPHALDVPPGSSESTSARDPGTPENADDFKTRLAAIKDPGARQTYFRKHKAKFGL